MKPVPPHHPLRQQCLRQVTHFFTRQNLDVSADALTRRAEWVITQIRADPKLWPADVEPNSATGISDSYLDRIIEIAATECPRVTALAMGSGPAWEGLLDFIHRRSHTYLRKYNVKPLDRDILVDDLVQSCAFRIWQKLSSYRYDAAFEAWASKVISTEVRRICFAKGFTRYQSTISFDQPILDERTSAPVIIESQSDQLSHEVTDLTIVLKSHPAWPSLNRLQRDVCLRVAAGESQRAVAGALGKSLSQIQSIQSRARSKFELKPRFIESN